MYALSENLGSVQLYHRVPDVVHVLPIERALSSISLGAQNFDAYRKSKAPRRAAGVPGVWEFFPGGWDVNLEAFGESAEQLQQAIDRYQQSYTYKSYRTEFSKPKEIDGEFVAFGSRNTIRDWY
jgi:hypothetical protein